MNNNEIKNLKTMTSLEIAELTGKPHNDVMKAIRKMEDAWAKTCGGKFSLTSRTINQPNGGTREVPCYNLTKTECLYIATKFNDEARAKLVLRWEELERERKQAPVALPDFTNPAEAARAWANEYEQKLIEARRADIAEAEVREKEKCISQLEDNVEELKDDIEVKKDRIDRLRTIQSNITKNYFKQKKEVIALSREIETMQPKVDYCDLILNNSSTVTITQIAQDYGMSAKALNKKLQELHIQRKVNGQWILYREYLTQGYVHSKPIEIETHSGDKMVKYNTEWTQKGRLFLYNKLKESGILPLIERQ